MNAGTLALLIPILAIVGSFIVSIMKLREKQSTANNEQASHNKALQEEIGALRSRIEVLERLVTDDSFQLKRELEKA
jgi:uncharacterized membrane protein